MGVQAGLLVRPPPLSAVLGQYETTESIHVKLPGGWRGRQKQDTARSLRAQVSARMMRPPSPVPPR